jgi:hypothetical protein
MVKTWPKATGIGDHFGDAVSMIFGPAFESPHLKKINDSKIFVLILKKQRPQSDNERARRLLSQNQPGPSNRAGRRGLESNVGRVSPFLFSLWVVSVTQHSHTEKRNLVENNSTLLKGAHTIRRPLKDCGLVASRGPEGGLPAPTLSRRFISSGSQRVPLLTAREHQWRGRCWS